MVLSKEELADRVAGLLDEVCEDARSRGMWCSEPVDRTDEEYSWSVLVVPEGGDEEEDGVDVTVTVAESGVRGDEEGGLNFTLDVASYGGEVIGGLAPYNYTPDVWVDRDDPVVVEERWNVFQNAFDAAEVVDSIVDHWGRRAPPAAPAGVPRAPAVSAADVETIDRHRASIGMAPIDPEAGWTPAELREMAQGIRETGRMGNPVAALRRRLMPPR